MFFTKIHLFSVPVNGRGTRTKIMISMIVIIIVKRTYMYMYCTTYTKRAIDSTIDAIATIMKIFQNRCPFPGALS